MQPLVDRAMQRGLVAAGVLSPKGAVLAVSGDLEADELRAIAAFVSHARPADFLDRLFAGELVRATVADREICLGVAGRCVFVLTVLGPHVGGAVHATELFRDEVDATIALARDSTGEEWTPPISGPSGSGSPPAEAFVFLPSSRRTSGGSN